MIAFIHHRGYHNFLSISAGWATARTAVTRKLRASTIVF
jgi:hypothetical protein